MVFKRKLLKFIGLVLAVWISIIPAKIAIASYQAPVPQAIFVLGGDFTRIEFAAKFGQSHNNLDIWVSDVASNLEYNRLIFHKFGVVDQRLHLDGRATDTVTNFTTLAADFVNQKLQNIFLITSDYHMRRAKAIATIVLGSQGIAVTPIAVPSQENQSESQVRVLRDCGRSILWILSGRSGASFNPRLK
ncbi:MAG: YdcF family protein [Aulosira sp. ZfuVER01]|nr:YdcF family protein [Aulosira sp. ZfuVER01]MDZ7999172.1 YdcF family protein [Aulosira sp. DedVER01a]MDZ8051104.1 YdcF family protein [Aulosira sp. ZfuCHP01]